MKMATRLKGLRPYLKNIVASIFAILMLIAFLFLSPWISVNRNAAAGAFANRQNNTQASTGQTTQQSSTNTDSTPSSSGSLQAPSGFQSPSGFEAPAGFQSPTTATQEPTAQPSIGSADTTTNQTQTGGFQPPAGFNPSQLPAGFDPNQLPAGFDPSQLPAGFTPPTGGFGGTNRAGVSGILAEENSPIRLLVPIAAVIALLLAGLSAYRPRFNRLATILTALAGLAALVFFIVVFVSGSTTQIAVTNFVTPGFWLALVGNVGLVGQSFIPRNRKVAADEGDVRDIIKEPRKRSGLSIGQNIGVAIDALMANKLRSGLTMLGVIIGVASVVSLLSVGRGAQSAVTEQIESAGTNLLTISPGSRSGFGFGGGIGGGGGVQTLTYNDAVAIQQQITGISAVLPQYNGNLQVRSDQTTLQTSIIGTTPDYLGVRNLTMDIGDFLTASQYDSVERVAVLGQEAASELFSGLNPIGRNIRINGKIFQVVGVLSSQDSGFGGNANLDIYVPLTTAYRHLFNARATGSSKYRVSSIVISVTDSADVTRVSSEITTLLRTEHRLKTDANSDFSVQSQQQLLTTASNITGVLTVLLGAIASISLLVGGIGIMNIMLVSVTERTREIGLRKAIGARRWHILQQFLIETVFLSTLGGTLGVLLGVAIALLVNNSGLLTTSVTADSIALGLGFSIIIGVFFGVYPANQAASLQPIEALRYE